MHASNDISNLKPLILRSFPFSDPPSSQARDEAAHALAPIAANGRGRPLPAHGTSEPQGASEADAAARDDPAAAAAAAAAATLASMFSAPTGGGGGGAAVTPAAAAAAATATAATAGRGAPASPRGWNYPDTPGVIERLARDGRALRWDAAWGWYEVRRRLRRLHRDSRRACAQTTAADRRGGEAVLRG
jgi:hypothetical protein